MKYLIYILIGFFVVTLPSCSPRTPRAIAEKKLRKALRIDPTVLEVLRMDTTLYRYLKIPVVVKAPEINQESSSFDCDSLRRLFAIVKPGNKSNDSGIYIFRDSVGTSIKVLDKGNGKLAVAFHVPPRYIHDTVSITDTVKISVPARAVTIHQKAPCYTYFWFWGLLAALVLETILLVRSARQKAVVINNSTTPENPTKP